jgi:hypothetical protein
MEAEPPQVKGAGIIRALFVVINISYLLDAGIEY